MATIDPTKTTIPAEMLQVQNRIETPSLNLSDPTPDLQGVFSTLPQEQRQLEVDQAGQRTGASNFSSLVQFLTGMGADQAALEEKAGIGAIQKDVTDLTNQLNLLKAESQTIPLQTQQDYQGRLSTQAGVGAIETGKLRENAIKALTTSALLQAKQGSLLTAQNQVDRAIQLKYEPIKAQIEATRQQLEINDKYFITPAEKKLAEKQKLAVAERDRQINKQEQGEQQLLTLITNASSQGAPQELLRRAQAAKTPMEASMILGQYAGNYWAIEKAKQDALKAKKAASTTGGIPTSSEDAQTKISLLSKEAQSYINSIQRGETTRDAVFTKLGATKAALALKNEISVGLDLIAGGKTGSKIINSTEAANFQSLLNTMDNIDITAYGQFDTPGGLIFDIRNPTTAAYIDQIVASLSLEKRELLKGSGAISDYESRTLANAATILGRKNISEKAAKEALDDIRTIFEDKVKKYNEQVGLSPENDVNSPWNRARQSQESGLSSMAQKGHIDPNAPFGEIRFNLPTSTPIK